MDDTANPRRVAAQRLWQDPAYRAKQLERRRDPAIRARLSATLKSTWAQQRPRFKCLQPEHIAQIVRMSEQGMRTEDIAREFLVTRQTINRHLQRIGKARKHPWGRHGALRPNAAVSGRRPKE